MTLAFQQSVKDLIRMRKSARTHTGAALEPAKQEALTAACARLDRGILGEAARFTLLEKPFVKGENVRLGNYGLQKNPRYFFAGAVKDSEMSHESYGYLMEQLVLKATDLELGTCWIGFFDKKFFADFPVNEDERFPAACTVGYPADRRFFEKISRTAVRADKRKNWDALFFQGDFNVPFSAQTDSPYRKALEMVRLGPSSGNSQPWRIVRENDRPVFHFYMKKIRNIYFRAGLHHIDLGIAMCHFELTLNELGISGRWRRRDPDLQTLPPETAYTMTWEPRKDA